MLHFICPNKTSDLTLQSLSCLVHTGFRSRHSQSVGENHRDCRRRRHRGDSAEDDELPEAAVHHDYGKSAGFVRSRHPSSYWFRQHHSGLFSFRMCMRGTGPRPIRTWWGGSMRGESCSALRSMWGCHWERTVTVLSNRLPVCRFILSLASCKNCVVIDDQLNILPISSHAANIKPVPPKTQVA